MRLLDLFSGIGGFSLGLERAGFRTVAFCEIRPSCRRLLAHHWPDVPIYDDVTTLTAERLSEDGIEINAIAGGFPCQDISLAGAGAGIDGERSGLWREYARLVREIRPRIVIVENVPALLVRGFGRVAGDLAALGYDLWWDCIPASAVGAPHRRDRLWIVAYSRGEQHEGFGDAFRWQIAEELLAADTYGQGELDGAFDAEVAISSQSLADATWNESRRPLQRPQRERVGASREPGDVAHADDTRPQGRNRSGVRQRASERPSGAHGPCAPAPVADTAGGGGGEGHTDTGGCGPRAAAPAERSGLADHGGWLIEPDVGRVAHGIPSRVDRLHGLGNAVVPQIPELIGRAILAATAERERAA